MLPLSPLRKALFLDCLQMPPSSPIYGGVADHHTLCLSDRPYIQALLFHVALALLGQGSLCSGEPLLYCLHLQQPFVQIRSHSERRQA